MGNLLFWIKSFFVTGFVYNPLDIVRVVGVVYRSLTSDVPNIYVTVHYSIDGKCRHTFHLELFHDIVAVCYNCRQTDVKFVGNFFIYKPFDNKGHHFNFSVRKNFGVPHGIGLWQMASF